MEAQGSVKTIVDTKFPITYRLEAYGNDEIVLENDTG